MMALGEFGAFMFVVFTVALAAIGAIVLVNTTSFLWDRWRERRRR